MLRILPVLLACTSLVAADPWTKTDTALEIVSELGIACEWSQMLNSTSIKGIDAKLMGHNPSRAQLNRYFIGWLILHPIISYHLPSPWRNTWQGATIGFEIAVTSENARVGCKITF
jgi:hypothetical protein